MKKNCVVGKCLNQIVIFILILSNVASPVSSFADEQDRFDQTASLGSNGPESVTVEGTNRDGVPQSVRGEYSQEYFNSLEDLFERAYGKAAEIKRVEGEAYPVQFVIPIETLAAWKVYQLAGGDVKRRLVLSAIKFTASAVGTVLSLGLRDGIGFTKGAVLFSVEMGTASGLLGWWYKHYLEILQKDPRELIRKLSGGRIYRDRVFKNSGFGGVFADGLIEVLYLSLAEISKPLFGLPSSSLSESLIRIAVGTLGVTATQSIALKGIADLEQAERLRVSNPELDDFIKFKYALSMMPLSLVSVFLGISMLNWDFIPAVVTLGGLTLGASYITFKKIRPKLKKQMELQERKEAEARRAQFQSDGQLSGLGPCERLFATGI